MLDSLPAPPMRLALEGAAQWLTRVWPGVHSGDVRQFDLYIAAAGRFTRTILTFHTSPANMSARAMNDAAKELLQLRSGMHHLVHPDLEIENLARLGHVSEQAVIDTKARLMAPSAKSFLGLLGADSAH